MYGDDSIRIELAGSARQTSGVKRTYNRSICLAGRSPRVAV